MLPKRKLLYLGLTAAFSASPWVAEADVFSPTFQGTIKCHGVDASGAKFDPAPYSVGLVPITDSLFRINGRWGGHSVTYGTAAFGVTMTPPKGTLSLFHFDGGEGYSETGQLKLKTDKNGKTKLEGDSIVSLTNAEWGFPDISADCEWKLTETPYFDPP